MKSDNIEEDFTKLVYLKTGMPFDDERELVGDQGYSFAGVGDLKGFLTEEPAASSGSDLVQQYREWIIEKHQELEVAEREWNMGYGPIQHRFLARLQKRVEDSTDTDLSKNRNRGGGAFSKLVIRHQHSKSWPMFWRIDPGRPLCLRFYRWGDKKTKGKNAALVEKYRPRFEEAVAGAGLTLAKQKRLRPASWEPTISGIEWPSEDDRSREMESFLDAVAQVHRRFLELLRQSSRSED